MVSRTDAAADYARVLDEVRGLTWPVRRRVPGGPAGSHASYARGSVGEFDEYRPYRQGSDTRRIDWKLFARTERAFTRIALEPAIFSTQILLDGTASMAFPETTLEKWRLASSLSLGLLAIARNSGDPAGLSVAHNVLERSSARTGTGAIRRSRDMLEACEPAGSWPLAPELIRATRRGTRIVLITDFLGDASDMLIAARRAIVAQCEVYAIHIVAAAEMDPSDRAGFVHDPEQRDVLRPLTTSALESYHAEFRTWRSQLAMDWQSAGAHFSSIVTGRHSAAYVARRIVSGAMQVVS